jgi:hypothetical protein
VTKKILLASIESGGARSCCRMFTSARSEHARHIRLTHEYITRTEPLKEHNTDEPRKCLLGSEKKCEDGPFEELGDGSLFQWDGKEVMVQLLLADMDDG